MNNITQITPLEFVRQFLRHASAEDCVEVLEATADRVAAIHGFDCGLSDAIFEVKKANVEQEMADEEEDAMRSYLKLSGRG